MPAKDPGLDMDCNHHTGKNPRILILGSTGRIGKAAIAALEQTPDSHQVVHASRNRDQVDACRGEGKDAVHLDLDDPRTFPEALRGSCPFSL
jgi:NAD(P)H dehydrogenase (quinone)